MNDGVGGGKIQADPARFQADQEDGNRGIALEAIHNFLTLFGRAIEIAEWNLELLQAFTDEMQHRDELAEDEHAMFAVDRFLEELVQEVQLGGGLGGSASFQLAFWGECKLEACATLSRRRSQQTWRKRSRPVSIFILCAPAFTFLP